MLRSLKDLDRFVLVARDGEIGRCKDFLFDDRQWVVRYMVADTGRWIPHRKVLVSPESFGEPDWVAHRFPVDVSKETIENAPSLEASADTDLHSLHEVVGYRVHATDDDMGRVQDLIVDDQCWAVRYLVVDTGDWLAGRRVLVSPKWLHRFDTKEREARIDLTPSQIEASPEYRPEQTIHRAFEADLHDAYGREGYWNDHE